MGDNKTKIADGTITRAEGGGGYIFTASTNEIDRHGDIVAVEGINYKNYQKNPVVLFQHDRSTAGAWGSQTIMPVGRVKKLWKEKGDTSKSLKAEIEFHEETELARTVGVLVEKGFLNAVSIGFSPLETEHQDVPEDLRGKGIFKYLDKVRVFKKSDLLEISIVDVPANASAIREKVFKAYQNGELSENALGIFGIDKAGAVLSKTNKDKLTKAKENIQAVIDSAGSETNEGDDKAMETEQFKSILNEAIAGLETRIKEYIDENLKQVAGMAAETQETEEEAKELTLEAARKLIYS